MTIDVAGRYLAAEPFDDALSGGIRVHTDRDELYEARTVDGHPVRIDGADDRWRVQVHLPASDDPLEGYDTFDTVAERLENTYREELITPATDFLDRLEGSNSVTAVDDTIEVRYRTRHAWKTDPGDGYRPSKGGPSAREGHIIRMTGAGAGTGGAAGIALGATAGPETAAVLGAGGAFAGAVAGFADGIFLYDILRTPLSLSYGVEKGTDWTRRKRKEFREWRANRQNRLEDLGTFDRFNEKQRLAAVKDETRDPHAAQRYRELRDSDVEENVLDLLERHFDRFDERQGVTAIHTTDSYEEAAAFATAALETGSAAVEQPSLHTNERVFRTIFEAAADGRQEELVETVLGNDGAGDAVQDYLDREYPGLVERIGKQQNLYGADEDAGGGHNA